MIDAGLLGVGELLPATFVHTLGRHRGKLGSGSRQSVGDKIQGVQKESQYESIATEGGGS